MNKSEDFFEYSRITRAELLPYFPKTANAMLELGCGQGFFVRMLKKVYPHLETWGIESNRTAASEASTQFDHLFTEPIIESIPKLPDNFFDVICCNDVLEHLEDPWSVLKSLKTKLNPNGRVVASIPNILELANLKHLIVGRDFCYENSGIRDRTHLRFFTKKSIIRLFKECGYKVEKIEGINSAKSLKREIFQLMTFGLFREFGFMQFAIVAAAC